MIIKLFVTILYCVIMPKLCVDKAGKGKEGRKAEVAEWSKAVDLGSIPKGRGFKPHLLHFLSSPQQIITKHPYHASINYRVNLNALSLASLSK